MAVSEWMRLTAGAESACLLHSPERTGGSVCVHSDGCPQFPPDLPRRCHQLGAKCVLAIFIEISTRGNVEPLWLLCRWCH